MSNEPLSAPGGDDRDLLRAALQRTPECPPLEALLGSRDASFQTHLGECPSCQAELALFHQFEAAEALPAEAAGLAWVEAELVRRSPAAAPRPDPLAARVRAWFGLLLSPAGRPQLAFAACALLVLLMAGVVLRPGTGVAPGVAQEPPVWRSGQFAATSPVGDLSAAPSELHWEAVPGATSYHVRLFEIDGTELWSADFSAVPAQIPGPIAAKFVPGRTFQWDVAARDAAGRTLSSTNLQSFHILVTSR